MNGEKRMEEDIIQRKKNLIMFPLGTIGRDMVYNLVTSYLLTYVLFTRALTAAQLAAISAIMVGARVFDALNDPIMGNIIERTRTRWGKFKPWLVIGIVTTSVVVYLFFNTKLQGWSFVWFFGVMYFMYSITYTMHDISYWGMVPALSSRCDARNQFTSRATLFAGIGGALARNAHPDIHDRQERDRRQHGDRLRRGRARNCDPRSGVSVLHNLRRARAQGRSARGRASHQPQKDIQHLHA